jgi:hypothetical protein
VSRGEPAWLTAKVDQRLAFMAEQFGATGTTDQMIEAFLKAQPTVVFTPLTEPPENATPVQFAQWDHTCDNCGKLCPHQLYTGSVTREKWGTQVIFMFGACAECKELP